MTPSDAVVAAVIERDGRYLVCRRPPEKRHGGMWEFPGGKVGPGEGFEAALRRELAEELGLTLVRVATPLADFLDVASGFRIHFVPARVEGEARLHEHTAATWCEPWKLATLELAPADRAFVERVLGGEEPGGQRGT